MSQALVGSNEYLIPLHLSQIEQLTVALFRPPFFRERIHGVRWKVIPERGWRALVK